MKSQAGNCWWLDKGLSRVFKGQTGFEFWVLRFRDLGASCFSLRLRVLRFRNYRFVAAMFAHMFIRLIIQNRFHLLLKNFSIWNSLSDVFSARCLVLPSPSIFVACAVEFQVGVLAREDFSVSNLPLQGLTIRRSCVCCSVCMRSGLRFTDSKHCFADD